MAFNAAGSGDSDGTITRYDWNFGDGTTGVGVQTNHNFTVAGTFTVTLTVTDNQGATGKATKTITVTQPQNVLPKAAFTATPQTGEAPLQVTLNAAASTDSDGYIANYAWSFGNGATGSGLQSTYTFTTAGTYNVVLTVTDNRGGTAQAA